MAAIGCCDANPAFGNGLKTIEAHELFNTTATNQQLFGAKGGVNTRATVPLMAIPVDPADLSQKVLVGNSALAGLP